LEYICCPQLNLAFYLNGYSNCSTTLSMFLMRDCVRLGLVARRDYNTTKLLCWNIEYMLSIVCADPP
jgi:hypothetical protein